jgi:hypothetical protein
VKRQTTETTIPAKDDHLLTYEDLSERWQLKPAVAKRRVLLGKIPVVRMTKRIVRVRLSDVVAYERQATAQLPEHYSDASAMRARKTMLAAAGEEEEK